jgi:hypothetical protein
VHYFIFSIFLDVMIVGIMNVTSFPSSFVFVCFSCTAVVLLPPGKNSFAV